MVHPLSRTDVRLGIVVVIGAVGLIGAGAFVLGETGTVRALGPSMSIALVPPVEPEILPGETMEVGALSDGFDRAALNVAAETYVDDIYLPPDAYFGEVQIHQTPTTTPMEAYRQVVAEDQPQDNRRDPLADGSRMFGFDAPRRDYAAERLAREAAMSTAMLYAPAQGMVQADGNGDEATAEYSPD